MTIDSRNAIRTKRLTGKSHLWFGDIAGNWASTPCGKTLDMARAEVVPWAITDEADRCSRCTKIAKETE